MFLQVLRAQDIFALCVKRWNEIKLGEVIQTLDGGIFNDDTLEKAYNNGARYALIGIPEDIGPRANGGRTGAQSCWRAFFKYFANQQSNCFLQGREILAVGSIRCRDLQEESIRIPEGADKLNYLRGLCARLDERIFPVIATLIAYGFIPIIIGGGHNNSYPIIKGVALGLSLARLHRDILREHPLVRLAFGENGFALGQNFNKRPLVISKNAAKLAEALDNINSGRSREAKNAMSDSICPEEMSLAEAVRHHLRKANEMDEETNRLGPVDDSGQHFFPISVVNCDPYGEFMALEGRHSGNSFSYAKLARYLDHYCLVYYHEDYNPSNMLTYMHEQGVRAFSYDSVFIRREFGSSETLDFVRKLMLSTSEPIGIELDLDSIEDIPTSESTPYGIPASEAAYYIHLLSSTLPAVYCYLPEGAPSLATDGERKVGKMLALLVSAFIKGHNWQCQNCN
ncbi:arginase family protein [bacterium]|nr:arginase family protein [bacterium]